MRKLLLLPLLVGVALALGASSPAEPMAGTAQRCHPSYPDFCIRPPPPDLNCPDIPKGRKPFRVRHDVVYADPHRFDRDRDGIGCE